MKAIIKEKAEKLAEFYRQKYIRNCGELYDESRQDGFDTHLIRISNFDKVVHVEKLDEDEVKIFDAYFKFNNDHEFNRLMSDFMLKTAKQADEQFGRESQERYIFAKLRPIIQNIAFTIVMHEGVSSLLKDDELNYQEHG